MPEIIIQTTELKDSGFIATVTLSNEQRLNCIDSKLARQLTAGIKKLGENPDLRAVKLQGAGKRAFIGGADIREMAELTPDTAKEFITTLHQTCAALRELPVPVVAQISGYCFGAGLEIAASCDLRIADHSASFAMPEVQIGLPSVIEAALLPRLIGAGRAAQLVYTGAPINAETAYQWGLIEQLTTPDTLTQDVDRTLQNITQADPAAIRMQKQLLRQWSSLSLEDAIQHSIEVFPKAYDTPAAQQRMQAFLNRKRNK